MNISKFIDVDAKGNAKGTYDKEPIKLESLPFN
jgi:hypothetical protein